MKKRLFAAVIVCSALLGIGAGIHHPTSTTLNVTPAASETTTSSDNTADSADPTSTDTTTETPAATSGDTSSSDLSNDNSYTNVDGNTVHSPAYSTDGSVPVGATARCVDGTYSFSQHRSGTCSYHGGVASWL